MRTLSRFVPMSMLEDFLKAASAVASLGMLGCHALPACAGEVPDPAPASSATAVPAVPATDFGSISKIRVGEIALRGLVHNLDIEASTLTIYADRFTVASGKSRAINPSKDRLIKLRPDTLILINGQKSRLEDVSNPSKAQLNVVGTDEAGNFRPRVVSFDLPTGVKKGPNINPAPPEPAFTTGKIEYLGKEIPLIQGIKSLIHEPTAEGKNLPLPPITLGVVPKNFERDPNRTYIPSVINWKLDFAEPHNQKRLLDTKAQRQGNGAIDELKAIMITLPTNIYGTQFIHSSEITYAGKPFIPDMIYRDPEGGNFYGVKLINGEEELQNKTITFSAEFTHSNVKAAYLKSLGEEVSPLQNVSQDDRRGVKAFRQEAIALTRQNGHSNYAPGIKLNNVTLENTEKATLSDAQKFLRLVRLYDEVSEVGYDTKLNEKGLLIRDVCGPLADVFNACATDWGLSSWYGAGFLEGRVPVSHANGITFLTTKDGVTPVTLNLTLQHENCDPLAMLSDTAKSTMFFHGIGFTSTFSLFQHEWVNASGGPVQLIYESKATVYLQGEAFSLGWFPNAVEVKKAVE